MKTTVVYIKLESYPQTEDKNYIPNYKELAAMLTEFNSLRPILFQGMIMYPSTFNPNTGLAYFSPKQIINQRNTKGYQC